MTEPRLPEPAPEKPVVAYWPDCPDGRRAVIALFRRRLAPGQVEVLCTWRWSGLRCHQWVPIGQLLKRPGHRLSEVPMLPPVDG